MELLDENGLPMTEIVELWSAHDQARLKEFEQAIKLNMPLQAMLALNRHRLDDLDQAINDAKPTIQDAEAFSGMLGVASSIATFVMDKWNIFLEPMNPSLQEIELAYVWEHKGGSPRTLALLWAYVATQCGYRSHWLEMGVFHPVCIGNGIDSVMIDSTAGALVSKADCREIFEAITDDASFDERMFLPPTATQIADHVLGLRLAGAAELEDSVATYQHLRFHAVLHHDNPKVLLTTALAAARIGDHGYAVETLETLMEDAKNPDMRLRFKVLIDRLRARFHYAN